MSDQPIDAIPIDAIKARIRNDIRAAMTAKAMGETKVLRTLLAALDNAEAVPTDKGHTPYVEHRFGDPKTEVARKTLTAADIENILRAEQDERLTAAAQLTQHGRTADAEALKAEAAIVARYL